MRTESCEYLFGVRLRVGAMVRIRVGVGVRVRVRVKVRVQVRVSVRARVRDGVSVPRAQPTLDAHEVESV
jgi:hypothetical protein